MIVPVLAGLAAAARPWGTRPLWWTFALIAPFIVGVALGGGVFYDVDQGASFWILGELAVLVLGVVTFLAAQLGAAIGKPHPRIDGGHR